MTILLDDPAEMSAVDPSFEPEKGMTTMTTASYAQPARRVRPHGIDRAVMRLSLMTLLWARRHAERTAVSYEEHTRLYSESRRAYRREHDAALLHARIR